MPKREKSNLGKLKMDYIKIQSKYNLPSFEKLNEDFQVEKALESETDILIREIRKFMADKFSNYLRFVEAILHPVNTPMFVFSIVKSVTAEEKNKLSEIYKELVKIEIKLIKLDLKFVEEEEADFIKETYKKWQGIKGDFLEIIGSVTKNFDNKSDGNSRGYFG